MANSAAASYQALLDIDKGTRSLQEQVTEAFRLLKLPLSDEQGSSTALVDSDPAKEGPFEKGGAQLTAKHEHVLRWLLNKQQAQHEAGRRARSSPESWSLISSLVLRLSVGAAARLLNAGKFLQVLDQALGECLESHGSLNGATIIQRPGSQGSEDESMDVSLESAARPATPNGKQLRASATDNQVPESLCKEGEQLVKIISSLLRAVGAIVGRATEQQPNEDAQSQYSREYMKSVLRSEPATAARILGSFLRLYPVLHSNVPTTRQIYEQVLRLEPFVEIWNSRSQPNDDTGGRLSNVSPLRRRMGCPVVESQPKLVDCWTDSIKAAFASHCLTPALHLLEICKSLGMQSRETQPVRTLETMLALRVVAPARTSFMLLRSGLESVGLETIVKDRMSTLQEFLTPLRAELGPLLEATPGDAPLTESAQRLMACIPSLFEIAIRCSPTQKSKDKVGDAAWLEAVLVVLAETAGISVDQKTQTKSRRSIHLLEQLLQVAIRRKLSISASTLRVLTWTSTGLFPEAEVDVQWSICARAITLNADVFLVPTDDKNMPRQHRDAKNVLLDCLFTQIVSAAQRQASEATDRHAFIQGEVLQPLVHAFSKARDLNGFLRRWHAALALLETDRQGRAEDSSNGSDPCISFLEDDQVLRTVQSLLQRSMTSGQLERLLKFLLVPLKVGDSATTTVTNTAFASVVILDAVFNALRGDVATEAMVELVRSVHRSVSDDVLSDICARKHSWRLWRVLAHIRDGWPSVQRTMLVDTPEVVVDQAKSKTSGRLTAKALDVLKSVDCKITHNEAPSAFRRAQEAFHFILSQSEPRSAEEQAQAHLLRAYELTVSHLEKYHSSSVKLKGRKKSSGKITESMLPSKAQWNGSMEGIRSVAEFAVASVSLTLFQYPARFVFSPSSVRERFWLVLFSLASEAQDALDKQLSEPAFGLCQVWEAAWESETIINNADVKDELVEVLLTALRGEAGSTRGANNVCAPARRLAVRTLFKLPPNAFRRRQREAMLDNLLQADYDREDLPSQLAAAVRLMQVPNMSSKLAMDPLSPWDLATKLRADSRENVLASFKELVSLNIKHLRSNVHDERVLKYLAESHEILRKRLRSARTFVDDLPLMLLIEECLKHDVRIHARDGESHRDQDEVIFEMRRQFLRILVSDVAIIREQSPPTLTAPCSRCLGRVLRTINSMLGVLDIPGDSSGSEVIEEVAQKLMPLGTELNLADFSPKKDVSSDADHDNAEVPQGSHWTADEVVKWVELIPLIEIFAMAGSKTSQLVVKATDLLDQDLTIRDRATVLKSTRTTFSRMDGGEKGVVLLALLDQQSGRGRDRSSQLLLLRSLVPGLEGADSEDPKIPQLLYSRLCEDLVGYGSAREFRLCADCLETIITKKIFILSQWDVEHLLSRIVSVTSKAGPPISSKSAGLIFQHLCRLFSAMLTVYRVKLRGRSHLVVQLMTALLHVLFGPDARAPSPRSIKARPRPPWLSGKGSHLGVADATAYARLLTTLCDPSISAVATGGHRKQQQLTPATDKARRQIGQHLPYLLMEYAQCQLHSRLSPGVREALLPGLYAVFEVTSKEMLRMINAGMDPSSRAVFKALYEGYRRFGRWDQS